MNQWLSLTEVSQLYEEKQKYRHNGPLHIKKHLVLYT